MTSADLSIITLIMNASVVVKCVMGILLIASLSSWATIFSKMLVLSRSRRQTNDFEKRFWSGLDLAKLYETASTRPERTGAQERMFVAGMNEFLKMPDRPADDVLSGVRRSMNATFQREMDALEKGLPMLASIGSVSPYIGLFGTVWGIYHALLAIGAAGQSSLDKVAGPVGEALIMTGFGLAVALPAVLIYNFFVRRNRLRLAALEEFGHDLFTLLVTGFEQVATNNVTPLVERETRQGRG